MYITDKKNAWLSTVLFSEKQKTILKVLYNIDTPMYKVNYPIIWYQEPAYLSTPDFSTLTIIKLIENFQFWFQVRPTKWKHYFRRGTNALIKYNT
jgi:hypothetical protein